MNSMLLVEKQYLIHTTVIRQLDEAGYKSKIAAHNPLISKKELKKV